MKTIIEQYDEEKQYLDSIEDGKYPYLKLGKVLATQIWKTLNKSNREIVKRFFSIILCNKYTLNIDRKLGNGGRYLLSASAGELRDDNQTIIQNGKSFIEPCSLIRLKKGNFLAISSIIPKSAVTIHYFIKFKKIKNIIHRGYLAANMSLVYQLSKDLDKELWNAKFLLTFMDTDIFENYITQTIQFNGGKVAALQHGQRFYINEPCDSYVGMDNMSADYKLVWSRFSRSQYQKAGYPVERLPIIGSTKYLCTKHKSTVETKTIGIFLDGPFSYGSRKSNNAILNIVIKVAKETGYKCLVKPHPVDKLENYHKIVGSDKIIIAEPGQSIESLSDQIDFGIVHTSGVSVDLLILDVPVFVYKSETVFPIDLPDSYFFSSEDEFLNVMNNTFRNKSCFLNEFSRVRKQYVEDNPYQLHQEFFSQFGAKI